MNSEQNNLEASVDGQSSSITNPQIKPDPKPGMFPLPQGNVNQFIEQLRRVVDGPGPGATFEVLFTLGNRVDSTRKSIDMEMRRKENA